MPPTCQFLRNMRFRCPCPYIEKPENITVVAPSPTLLPVQWSSSHPCRYISNHDEVIRVFLKFWDQSFQSELSRSKHLITKYFLSIDTPLVYYLLTLKRHTYITTYFFNLNNTVSKYLFTGQNSFNQ